MKSKFLANVYLQMEFRCQKIKVKQEIDNVHNIDIPQAMR